MGKGNICLYKFASFRYNAEEFGRNHFVIWQEAHEAIALGKRRVAFMIHGQIGMIELLEKEEVK